MTCGKHRRHGGCRQRCRIPRLDPPMPVRLALAFPARPARDPGTHPLRDDLGVRLARRWRSPRRPSHRPRRRLEWRRARRTRWPTPRAIVMTPEDSAVLASLREGPLREEEPPEPLDMGSWAGPYVRGLTLREKVGQLIMPWVLGDFAPEGSPSHERIAGYVEEQGVGGVIMSVGTPIEVAAKLNDLQRHARSRCSWRPTSRRAPASACGAPSTCPATSTSGARPTSRRSWPSAPRARASRLRDGPHHGRSRRARWGSTCPSRPCWT
jgi:hypothetical protein